MAARHIFAVTLEDALRWNFVVSLVASFVAASRSRCVTIRPVVSSLFDPAKRGAAGGRANQNLKSGQKNVGQKYQTFVTQVTSGTDKA